MRAFMFFGSAGLFIIVPLLVKLLSSRSQPKKCPELKYDTHYHIGSDGWEDSD
ncbi:hypothetical protein [Halobacillus sp. A5]|uniref:hypothetical protein n=1 Tax=Halobacillus sp. A5 TaxID=2880263 RepID=UPI0020A6A3F3|nr:hypothetical protein [Halobacillus sp. A5]MCP3026559.1 hypothetical protein [Halobacillus sp. A5]